MRQAVKIMLQDECLKIPAFLAQRRKGPPNAIFHLHIQISMECPLSVKVISMSL